MPDIPDWFAPPRREAPWFNRGPATAAPQLTVHGHLFGWRTLWVKYVAGFNPRVHCQDCLIGETDRSMARRLVPDQAFALSRAKHPIDYDALYLCGGHESWDWSKNLHLVAVPEEGATAEIIASTGSVFRISGARAIQIPPLALGYAGRAREFTTCRNWRFGVAYYGLDPMPRAFDPLGQRGAPPATSG
jgi:hypothetical protein